MYVQECVRKISTILPDYTLRKLYLHFLSNGMGYDRGDSFPFDFWKIFSRFFLNWKENCHHDHIPFTVKANGNIVFSVYLGLYHVRCHVRFTTSDLSRHVHRRYHVRFITPGVTSDLSRHVTSDLSRQVHCRCHVRAPWDHAKRENHAGLSQLAW